MCVVGAAQFVRLLRGEPPPLPRWPRSSSRAAPTASGPWSWGCMSASATATPPASTPRPPPSSLVDVRLLKTHGGYDAMEWLVPCTFGSAPRPSSPRRSPEDHQHRRPPRRRDGPCSPVGRAPLVGLAVVAAAAAAVAVKHPCRARVGDRRADGAGGAEISRRRDRTPPRRREMERRELNRAGEQSEERTRDGEVPLLS